MDLDGLENRIGYKFSNRAWIQQALITRSFQAEHPELKVDNERLEFLGDSVLSLVISEILFTYLPPLTEGEMSMIRSGTVNTRVLAEIARQIGLEDILQLGNTNDNPYVRDTLHSKLADGMEAILGAVFMDGGWEKAVAVVRLLWGKRVESQVQRPRAWDYKTRFQEAVQPHGKRLSYRVRQEGPDHNPVFFAQVLLDGQVRGDGEGSSKKEAEQQAAQIGLESWMREAE